MGQDGVIELNSGLACLDPNGALPRGTKGKAFPMNLKPITDMTGQTFARLTVVARAGVKWKCRCECGAEIEVMPSKLRSGHTKSCGCLRSDKSRARVTTHGKSRTRTHNSWLAMKQRCNYPANDQYARYGARGIKVCERWLNSFENFLVDMGERPAGHTLDRYPDKDGNYEPGNCRWATDAAQMRNRRSTIMVERAGVTKCVKDWCDELGIKPDLIYGRIRRGASPEQAFE